MTLSRLHALRLSLSLTHRYGSHNPCFLFRAKPRLLLARILPITIKTQRTYFDNSADFVFIFCPTPSAPHCHFCQLSCQSLDFQMDKLNKWDETKIRHYFDVDGRTAPLLSTTVRVLQLIYDNILEECPTGTVVFVVSSKLFRTFRFALRKKFLADLATVIDTSDRARRPGLAITFSASRAEYSHRSHRHSNSQKPGIGPPLLP